MTSKDKKNIIIFLIVAGIVVAIIVIIMNKIKSGVVTLADATKGFINDEIANSPVGAIMGNRTRAAQDAFDNMQKMNFLNHDWITKANKKYNRAGYSLPTHLSTQEATDYARALKASQAVISTDYTNDNERALGVLRSLVDEVQAAQVADAYYNIGKHKNLARGLAWMSNDALVEANAIFSKLPSGVYLGGTEIPRDQITV